MSTAIFGVVFLVVGLAAMFLMYHLWGYPFDKVTKTSAAPKWAMMLHRVLGYMFGVIYVGLMIKMVPRLWQYQVEFPARTTVHIVLGFTIGFLLIIKIAIMRFFRHFEEWMPYLGTAIMLGTVILLGLSLPYAFQERMLASSAPKGNVTSKESLARVAAMLPTAEFPDGVKLAELATAEALNEGHRVLVTACVRCHDLRTILVKPRTPSGWREVVDRMAEKPALFEPIPDRDLHRVTAYLIAITPDLAKSSQMKREEAVAKAESLSAAAAVAAGQAAATTGTPDAGASSAAGSAAPSPDASAGSAAPGAGSGSAVAATKPGAPTKPAPVKRKPTPPAKPATPAAGSGSAAPPAVADDDAAGEAAKPADPAKPAEAAKPTDLTKPAPPADPAAKPPAVATTPPPTTPAAATPAPPTTTAPPAANPMPAGGELARAQKTFQAKCSQCHSTDEVKRHPPKSAAQTSSLIKRMIEENDAVFSAAEIQAISTYINATYVK
jgi:hypothetical protein